MEDSLKELLTNLKQLKSIDIENLDISGYKSFQTFFEVKGILKQNLKWCDIAINGVELESTEETLLKISIISTLIDIIGEPNHYNCVSVLSLLQNKIEPNYNILPKIKFGSKSNYENILDLIFSYPNKTIKIIQLVEFIRQKEYTLTQFLNLAIRVRVIHWFTIYEPKTLYWINDFINSVPASYETNIDDIIELLES